MSTLIRSMLLSLAVLSQIINAAPTPHGGMHGKHRKPQGAAPGSVATGKAIYFLTNDAQNAVVAVPIGADGTLSAGTVTATGGQGSNAIDGSTNTTSAPDALVGQSSLTVVGQNLFAVNAGSNTLTMMAISPQDPTNLTMLGTPIAVSGEFPNTVAASAKHSLVCVGSTGAAAGIACTTFSASGLAGSTLDALRPFALQQSTPPVGPTNTVSQAFFSADESVLFTTVKGDPAVNNTGFLSAFPVTAGTACGGAASLSTTETRSSPPGTAVLFGAALIPSTNSIFVTDASFGAGILAVDPATNQASLAANQTIADQKATCWATVSDATGSAFVTDVGVNRVLEMSLQDASILSTIDLGANGDPGLIDLKAAGGFVYALSPGNGTTGAAVAVVDARRGQGKGKAVQHFDLTGLGAGKNAQGMAVLL